MKLRRTWPILKTMGSEEFDEKVQNWTPPRLGLLQWQKQESGAPKFGKCAPRQVSNFTFTNFLQLCWSFGNTKILLKFSRFMAFQSMKFQNFLQPWWRFSNIGFDQVSGLKMTNPYDEHFPAKDWNIRLKHVFFFRRIFCILKGPSGLK